MSENNVSDGIAEFELTGANSLRGPYIGLSDNAVSDYVCKLPGVFNANAAKCQT